MSSLIIPEQVQQFKENGYFILERGVDFFLDQFVVKSAEKELPFSWHQDSGYIPFDHKPYVTCWTALVDVTDENGTVYLMPYSELAVRFRVTQTRDPGTQDMVGYWGSDPGIQVLIPAGSVAVFSSICFHRRGPNTTNDWRRIMLTQYADGPIVNPFTKEQPLCGVTFLRDGKPLPLTYRLPS